MTDACGAKSRLLSCSQLENPQEEGTDHVISMFLTPVSTMAGSREPLAECLLIPSGFITVGWLPQLLGAHLVQRISTLARILITQEP